MKKQVLLIVVTLLLAGAASAQPGNTWKVRANFGGIARERAVGLSIGNYGYIGTGFKNATTAVKDFWQYDPSNDTWAQKADFGGNTRGDAVGFSIGNFGYIGLGTSLNKQFWQYDPSNNTWAQKATFGGVARYGAVGFSLGGYGYVALGYSGTAYLNDVWQYNPGNDTWTQKGNFPGASRKYASCFTIGNFGYAGTGDAGSAMADFWQYNRSNDTWTQKTNFAGGVRTSSSAFSVGNYGYIGLGYDGLLDKQDLWEYDPETNFWTQRADFANGPRRRAAAFTIGTSAFAGTGGDGTLSIGTLYTDLLQYIPEGIFCTVTGSPFCSGSTITVNYSSYGIIFNAGNAFKAQLSDETGSFANTVYTIGNLSSTASSGSISSTLPVVLTTGSLYRIRVTSNNPVSNNSNNGTDLTINAATVWFADVDLDGYGNPNSTIATCTGAPPGYIATSGDCNDNSAAIHPGVFDICANGIDDNCNGQVDENLPVATITPSGTVNICAGVNTTLTANSGASLTYQWKKSGTNITGATNSTYTTHKKGSYTVQVTNTSGCQKISAITKVKITCRDEQNVPVSLASNERLLSVFPNPTASEVTLMIPELENDATLAVYNEMGTLVMTQQLVAGSASEMKLSLKDQLQSGMYLIRIIGEPNIQAARFILVR